MAGPRSTYLYNTVLDAQSNPVPAGKVTVSLLPATAGVTYNHADSYQGDTVSTGVLSTKTADTAPASVPTVGHTAGATSVGAGSYKYQVAFLETGTDGIAYESAASAQSATVTASAGDTINLTALPLGGVSCTGRAIYRTDSTGANAAYLATIADNTTTTFNDTHADTDRNTNRTPLALGGWQMPLVALGDLTGNVALSYQVVENGVTNVITTFAYSATAVHASTLYNTAGAGATPTAALTGYVLDAGGNPKVGVSVTAKLSQDGTSTVSGNSVSAASVITAVTDSNGMYTLNLVPTDKMTPNGLYYTVTEGPNAVAKTITAPHGGGTVNGSVMTPATASVNTILRGLHLGGGGSAPTMAVNANAGTGAAVTGSLKQYDSEGYLGWTSGTAAWATGDQFDVTFALPFTDHVVVSLIPDNAATWTAFLAGHFTWTETLTGFSISLSVADSAATTYKFRYQAIGF